MVTTTNRTHEFSTFNSLSCDTSRFTIRAMVVVLDIDQTVKISKKLKLTGVPYNILKNMDLHTLMHLLHVSHLSRTFHALGAAPSRT
ncbi:hypothetical protein AN958_03587 [Leucoagaricus sp. SymC.cos]|nr:hypothetical protein AN958_03587 [Leucoagaricus sp. SymC.cos]